MFQEFVKALLNSLLPIIGDALKAIVQHLIDGWLKNPAAAAIVEGVTSPDELHAAMPKLLDSVDTSKMNFIQRLRFRNVRGKLESRAVSDTVWNHLLYAGTVDGSPTGVTNAQLFEAVV